GGGGRLWGVGGAGIKGNFTSPACSGGAYPNAELRLKTPAGERPSPSCFTGPSPMAPPCKPLPQAIPLRPTTIGIFSPTAFHWSLIESRSYSLISPLTAFHPPVVTRTSWRDSAIATCKDEFIRIESTLIIKYDRLCAGGFLMDTTITIPIELANKIAERAAARGLDMEEYACEVLERDVELSAPTEPFERISEQRGATNGASKELRWLKEHRHEYMG